MVQDARLGKEVASNPWSKIFYFGDSKTLLLEWLASSKEMSDDAVKQTLERFADAGEELRPSYLLVDMVHFGRGFTDEMNAWRDVRIIPAYNAAGVQKMAFLVPEQQPYSFEKGNRPENEPGANFPTGWFSDRDNLNKWLSS